MATTTAIVSDHAKAFSPRLLEPHQYTLKPAPVARRGVSSPLALPHPCRVWKWALPRKQIRRCIKSVRLSEVGDEQAKRVHFMPALTDAVLYGETCSVSGSGIRSRRIRGPLAGERGAFFDVPYLAGSGRDVLSLCHYWYRVVP
jgi:hypothetical protein